MHSASDSSTSASASFLDDAQFRTRIAAKVRHTILPSSNIKSDCDKLRTNIFSKTKLYKELLCSNANLTHEITELTQSQMENCLAADEIDELTKTQKSLQARLQNMKIKAKLVPKYTTIQQQNLANATQLNNALDALADLNKTQLELNTKLSLLKQNNQSLAAKLNLSYDEVLHKFHPQPDRRIKSDSPNDLLTAELQQLQAKLKDICGLIDRLTKLNINKTTILARLKKLSSPEEIASFHLNEVNKSIAILKDKIYSHRCSFSFSSFSLLARETLIKNAKAQLETTFLQAAQPHIGLQQAYQNVQAKIAQSNALITSMNSQLIQEESLAKSLLVCEEETRKRSIEIAQPYLDDEPSVDNSFAFAALRITIPPTSFDLSNLPPLTLQSPHSTAENTHTDSLSILNNINARCP